MRLVDTAAAVAHVLAPGASPEAKAFVRRRIYNLARQGKLTRYYRGRSGEVMWDLDEIHAIKIAGGA